MRLLVINFKSLLLLFSIFFTELRLRAEMCDPKLLASRFVKHDLLFLLTWLLICAIFEEKSLLAFTGEPACCDYGERVKRPLVMDGKMLDDEERLRSMLEEFLDSRRCCNTYKALISWCTNEIELIDKLL